MQPPCNSIWQPDGQFRRLDPHFVPAERIGSSIAAAVVAALIGAAVVGATAAGWLSGLSLAVAALVWLLFVGLLAWLAIRYPQWEYEHIRYAVSENGMEIHRGILWRGITNVPRSRIQHTDVSQGPIGRRYGIATLQIYTAGTEYNEVDLEGLAYDVALGIRDFLVREPTSHDS